jgi:hypothetical protein
VRAVLWFGAWNVARRPNIRTDENAHIWTYLFISLFIPLPVLHFLRSLPVPRISIGVGVEGNRFGDKIRIHIYVWSKESALLIYCLVVVEGAALRLIGWSV